MARDVEFNVTANDRTGSALSAVERRFQQTSKRIDEIGKKSGDSLGRSLLKSVAATSPKLASGILSAVETSAGAAGPLLGGIGIAAAPIIASSLSAAIIGGAGIGGVVGGVVLASRDARVQSAGKDLGKKLLGTLTQQSQVFIGPVLQSIDTIGDSFDRVSSKTESIFRNSAKYVEPLTRSTTSAFESVIGGVDKLVARAGPVIDAISRGIENTGADIGDLFSDISENADGAAAGVDALFSTISGLIKVTGPVITGLTAVNEQLTKLGFSGGLLNSLDRLNSQLDTTGTFTRHVAGETKNLNGAVGTATEQANAYFSGLARVNSELEEQASASRDAYGATTSAAEATARATAVIKENGRNLKLNTEKGRENRNALSDLAAAYIRQYDATVKVNGVGAQSAAVANRNRSAFIALAEKAGYSAGKARELASSLGLIPAKKTTKVDANTSSASSRVSAFKKQLASVDTSRTVTFFVNVSESAKAAALRKNSAKAFSAHSFAGADNTDGVTSRVGGATPVSVQNSVDIFLDGDPFRSLVTRAVSSSERRLAWRQRVGRR